MRLNAERVVDIGGDPMEVIGPKELIYRYDGDPDCEEVLMDSTGTIPIPAADDIIMRKGRTWKVAYAHVEGAVNEVHVPTVSVFLIENIAASARAA
jgi:hypothetical protein